MVHIEHEQRLLHFKVDGRLIHQEEDWFKGRVDYLICQSELSTYSKYVAFFTRPEFSVVKYDREGSGTLVSQFNYEDAIE